MSDEAVGIHAHSDFKLGLQPAIPGKPSLQLGDFLTGKVPAHPVTADHFNKLAFGMYGNDKYGVCGPTSVGNLRRLITGGLLGKEKAPTQAAVFDLYRRSGNPNFDPKTDADDNGVVMQTMLEALLSGGIGGVKPVAFAKVRTDSNEELAAAVSIFGGTLFGATLQVAQQAQTDANPPEWDYSPSDIWGGHAILHGTYEGSGHQDVISWAKRVRTTQEWRKNQLDEAWVVIWNENVQHPAFQAGVDVSALKSAYKQVTGSTLNV